MSFLGTAWVFKFGTGSILWTIFFILVAVLSSLKESRAWASGWVFASTSVAESMFTFRNSLNGSTHFFSFCINFRIRFRKYKCSRVYVYFLKLSQWLDAFLFILYQFYEWNFVYQSKEKTVVMNFNIKKCIQYGVLVYCKCRHELYTNLIVTNVAHFNFFFFTIYVQLRPNKPHGTPRVPFCFVFAIISK